MKYITLLHNERFLKRLIVVVIGFMIIALGTSLMLAADIGFNPWTTLIVGLMNITTLNFGVLSQLIGLILIVVTIILGVKPGIATVLDFILIGFFINKINQLNILQTPNDSFLQLIYCIGGLIIFCFGITLYLKCHLGAGPRNGLMISLIKKTGYDVALVNPAIDIIVLLIGIVLGATIGIGTLITTFFTGIFLKFFFNILNYKPA